MSLINKENRNCAQGSSEAELRRGVFSRIVEVANRGVSVDQFEQASRSGRAELAAAIGRTHHVVSATWSHTRAVARQILNDAGQPDLPWYVAVTAAAKLGMTALPDSGQRELLIRELRSDNDASLMQNSALPSADTIEISRDRDQLEKPSGGVSGTTTDYSTARKERWRVAVIRDALDRMLPKEGRENLRVVSLTGVYCEREVKHLIAIGLKPAKILAVEGTKDPELSRIFLEKATTLGIIPFNGTLEQAFKRFREPFDVVLLDFPGQLSPSYMELVHQIPLARNAYVMFNLMASREHRFTQEVLESTHDIVFGEKFSGEMARLANSVVGVKSGAGSTVGSSLGELKLTSLPSSILRGGAAEEMEGSSWIPIPRLMPALLHSPSIDLPEQPLSLGEIREQIADCTLLKFFGVGFESMPSSLREELLELTKTFDKPGPLDGSLAKRMVFYSSLDRAIENAGASCAGALRHHQYRVALPDLSGWIITLSQPFYLYPSIVQAQRLAYQSEVGSRRTFITSVAHLRSNDPPSGAWYRPLDHFARSLVIEILKSAFKPDPVVRPAITIVTPEGRPIGNDVVTGKCLIRLVRLPAGTTVAEVPFAAIQRNVFEHIELQRRFPLSASKNFTALARRIVE